MDTLSERQQRFICSFVKRKQQEGLKPNVVVIAASNAQMARIKLVKTYGVVDSFLSGKEAKLNLKEGIKTIRNADVKQLTL